MSNRKRANAGGSSSQAKRARIEQPALVPDNAAEESSLSSVNGSQPGTPPPIAAGAAASKGLAASGRTVVPTESGTVDETTMGAENLPHADAPSSPEMPLAAAPPRIKREEDDTDTALLAGGTTIDAEEFKDEVRSRSPRCR